MSLDNGGPAFPVPGLMDDESFNGMTLRDYFAAKAMAGMLSDRSNVERFDEMGRKELISPDALMATASYAMADAMLAARNEPR